jgi:hypothetical protein
MVSGMKKPTRFGAAGGSNQSKAQDFQSFTDAFKKDYFSSKHNI